jgi:zinc protease
MSRSLRTLVLLLAVVAAPEFAQSAQPAPVPAVPRIEFEKYKLANGLEVILAEDRRLPLVTVNTWYHVGPSQEKAGRTGFAHLFEHMMFQGSKNAPGDAYNRLIEEVGGDVNASTSFDRTNYYQTVPSNQLELVLWLESDRMGFLLEDLDQAQLTNQKDVVRNERRESRENRPYGLFDEAAYHQLFPRGHPYYASIIGSHADVEAAQLGDVRDFFREYYVPNNATMVIAGDFDKAQVKALVAKYFAPIPAGKPVEQLKVVTPAITAERRAVVTDKVELPRVSMSWITPAIFQPGDAEADLLSIILGGGKSSRLYQKLVYEQQIAQDVSASQSSMMLGSVFQIEVTARPGVKPEQLEKAIDAELASLREQGPTAAEVERARNRMMSALIEGLETTGGNGGVADQLNRYNQFVGTPDYLQQDVARYTVLTPALLRTAAARMLVPQARAVIYCVPGEKVINDVPRGQPPANPVAPQKTAQDWRAVKPGPGTERPLRLPVPKRFTLDNGLTVMLFEEHRLPLVSANLVVLAGSDRNPQSRPGLASFTADILDEGTKTRSNLKIADELATMGASIGSGSTTDFSSISLRALKHTADDAFGILADIVQNPAFAPEEIERVRVSRNTQFAQLRDNPDAMARSVLYDALYGKAHPYGYIELGTGASIAAITRDELMDFWRKGYAPGNSALIVAGDISEAELRNLATAHFGKWSGVASAAAVPPVPQKVNARTLVVDAGAAPQTALRIGGVGVSRASPDYVPVIVMNNALGGLFSSRINLNLREKNGYAYGAGSAFTFRRSTGPYAVIGSVRTDATAPAVKEIFAEIGRMRDGPLTAEEFFLSRSAFSRSLPAQFETNADVAASGGSLFVYGLPLGYFNSLPGQIDAVTIADVQRVARQYLRPEEMVTVAVGDKAKIEQPLRELKQSPVEIRAAD